MNEIKASRELTTGQRIAVVHGDLTREVVDAIVNPANGWLAHGGGVAGAILRRAGIDLQLESDAWVDRHGQVPNGGVALTRGYMLPAGRVIHAVGPVWHGGGRDEERELGDAVTHTLDLAETEGCRSVAMPAISSGIFGFPRERCAEILFERAEAWFAAHPASVVRELRFTNIDAPTVRVFFEEFERRG
jgi:O-acetyl-ADP-ribose deacetylase (regulator of RNase III)